MPISYPCDDEWCECLKFGHATEECAEIIIEFNARERLEQSKHEPIDTSNDMRTSKHWTKETPWRDWKGDQWINFPLSKNSTKYDRQPDWDIPKTKPSYGSHTGGYQHKPEPKPWDNIDRTKWPKTWMFWVMFYHSAYYHRDTKYKWDGPVYSHNYYTDNM